MNKFLQSKIGHWLFAIVLACSMIISSVWVAQTAVTAVSGISVKDYSNGYIWNDVADGATSANGLTRGVLAAGLYGYDGTSSWQRIQMRANKEALRVVSALPLENFYSIIKADLTTTTTLSFGFNSRKVMVTAASGNTQNVCIDWLGASAVCPSANTAGDDVLAAGATITLDDVDISSISVVAASGTQSVTVRAWD